MQKELFLFTGDILRRWHITVYDLYFLIKSGQLPCYDDYSGQNIHHKITKKMLFEHQQDTVDTKRVEFAAGRNELGLRWEGQIFYFYLGDVKKLENDFTDAQQPFFTDIKEIKDKLSQVVPLAQHGQAFKESKRGSGKMATLLDQELKKILAELGENVTNTELINYIEELVDNFHPVFQDVDRDEELIYFKDPERRDYEENRTFKTIKNRIAYLKKIMSDKK